MRFSRLFILILGLFTASIAFSQISHGGTPYFLQPSILRSASSPYFIEMPSFNLDSVLREDAVDKGNMRGSYRFAHKFYTNININDGVRTVLPDGTIIKQIGIRSGGAYSINLLLRDFEIPPGGKLFIYSADHSYVVGSFDHRNNSTEKILPIQPVAGESIIVEYSEPANASFSGKFIIAEINHDYRDILRSEPGGDSNTRFNCMPDVFCEDVAMETIRSTVLLIINGNTLCSGSLINNTADDGKPYLLTAVHCFVDDLSKEFPTDLNYYTDRAGTIVAFFNYNRPVCSTNIKMKGSEEMSLAGATARAVASRKDIILLEFNESPPDYFNVYYAGWNRDLTANGKHTNIHHPAGAVKKYGMSLGNIRMTSVPLGRNLFDANSFWEVPNWTIGSTHDGSSGSPLFDENQLIIGGLTAGSSVCKGVSPAEGPDYFSSLGKAWETNQLKACLDFLDKGVMQYHGMDPNQTNPIIRLANARYTEGDLLITSKLNSPDNGYVFGNSNLQTLEFAEEFNVANMVEIFGTYLLIPVMPFSYTSDVTISVYTGNSYPETKIFSTSFIPRYLNYSSSSAFESVPKNLNSVPTETFVVFDKPLSVTNKFFISYSINYSASARFCVYNTEFSGDTNDNTAWIKDESKGWIPADKYELYPMKTSLAIHPLIRNIKDNQIEVISLSGNSGFYYDCSGRILTLKEPLNKQGQIAVYSISGQLLEKIPVQPAQTAFFLHERPKGTIGIVKIMSNDYSYTGKIMY